MRITFQEVQKNLSEIANRETYDRSFIFELLAAYGRSSASIKKLIDGIGNLAEDKENEILQKNVVYFKKAPSEQIFSSIENLRKDPLTVRFNPRYLITTDFKNLAAIDIKKNTTLDIKIADLDRNIDFFYGWTGDEVTDEKTEAVADRRAAEKMTELYNEISKVNKDKLGDKATDFRHDLNVFFSRLLFCFFAEDTKVFSKTEPSVFTNAVKDFTQLDGSDLDSFLNTLFESFDLEDKSKLTSPFSNFPYVNGGLFSRDKKIQIPKFNAQARKTIIECGSLQWSEINPDIFGSMFQGVVDEEFRSEHQMHYTSVPNILKTIEPLFLDELREEFDEYYDNPRKLSALHDRISKIKIFDPACGSGNFLVIAYKELRRLESAILERMLGTKLPIKIASRIKLDNFYGIEIIDIACEIAKLSLQIAKHQMDLEFDEQFHESIPFVPLKESGNITQENATRIDWNDVCPNKPHVLKKQSIEQTMFLTEEPESSNDKNNDKVVWDEIYLISNPPYQGGKKQDKVQKEDFPFVFGKEKYSKNIDYVALWFIKGADYISGTSAKLAFVSTNSICQGEHIFNLWPHIYKRNVEIIFGFTSFKWTNNARNSASVTCVIVGLASNDNAIKAKKLFTDGLVKNVKSINSYLTEGNDVIVKPRTKPISKIPEMCFGNMRLDGNYLKLSIKERDQIVNEDPSSIRFFRPLIDGKGIVDGVVKWCIWINDEDLNVALKNKRIKERVESVRRFRQHAGEVAQTLVNRPHQFRYRKESTGSIIVTPRTTTGAREYLPSILLGKDYITDDSVQVIYNAPIFVFALISSKMHMVWMKSVAGRLQDNYRYSAQLVYNTFPVPELNLQYTKILESEARNIILVRENHTEKTLSQMYDPKKMPEDLRKAHFELDVAVDRLYRDRPYENDEERLSDLFALYEKMTKKETVNV